MGCLENIQAVINTWPDSEHQAAIKAGVLAAYGVLKAETEELTLGEKFLTKCLELCDVVKEDRYIILQRIQALIYLGVIWCGRENFPLAREYLEKSLKVFSQFQEENSQDIFRLSDLLNYSEYKPDNQGKSLDSLITHAYYYLAQVEGKAGNSIRSAELCHTTLSRQLDRPSFDWMDWTRNCATLSQFYLNQENFTAARYHLAASLVMMDRYKEDDLVVQDLEEEKGSKTEMEKEVKEKDEEDKNLEEENENKESRRATEGIVSRFCAKYGLTLLEYSHCANLSGEPLQDEVGSRDKCPVFSNLDVSSRLAEVTDKRIDDYETGRIIFLWGQHHVTNAQLYYTKDERCSDYVELTRDLSQMYKHLIYFESDIDRKCKMHRRRADLLEPLNRELSPVHYLLTIRQILFELGEIFSDMVDLKRDRWVKQPSNKHFASKVNTLVNQAILYFQTFLDTMKIEGADPVKYVDDNTRPALLANFYLGRLASKYIVEEGSNKQLQNINNTYTSYKKIVDYCVQNPEAVEKFGEELEACKEMVRLLPVKMEKIRRGLIV
ncbi:KIF1-binding protein [Eurytemora carolleeae]|uniref:KIF1-binding protein n=1 Tax=Eurytemora carolleeae TaxID=1294199 RepID=UPI000C76C6F5|nr:KIF1-binding protein [Eurytemora carolleeae]|eukprot:XP_023341489.1 KIF1-binding protein-like [Eurytemora affinis]